MLAADDVGKLSDDEAVAAAVMLPMVAGAIEKTGNIGASDFRAGMRALGYVKGRNFELHERHADGEPARLVALAHELR
jgi:hypothetical protein